MAIMKYGEALNIEEFRSSDSIIADEELHNRFKKIAADIKKIAPKADDFLYFTAIMMHSAERAIYNEDGSLRKDAHGNDVTASWEVNEKTGSWKWKCSDASILPYRNCNKDIFPESELKIAHKKWIGKPLCKDHVSSSVDGIRGLILDTYWDQKHHRIISLCALDKVNYPDLARKVATGYARDVSMGTGVERAICYECGNIATTEAEYCNHIKSRSSYGEINVGLNPIELSLVVNGADQKAKILEVLAAAKSVESAFNKSGMNKSEFLDLKKEFEKLAAKFNDIEKDINNNDTDDNNFALKVAANLSSHNADLTNDINIIKEKMSKLENLVEKIATKFNDTEELMAKSDMNKSAYFQGTEEPVKPGTPQYAKEEADKIRMEDSHMRNPLSNLGPIDGIPPEDLEKKKMLLRASIEERRAKRASLVEKAQNAIKVAYPQGTQEKPKGGYPVDPGAKVRDTEFTYNKGNGQDGTFGDDKKVKEQIHRAELKARLNKASAVGDSRWDIINKADNKVVFSATLNELTNKKPALYSSVATADFAREIMRTIKSAGVNEAASIYKSAQDMGAPPPAAPAPDAGAAPEMPAPEMDAMPAEPANDPSDIKASMDALTAALDTLGDAVGAAKEQLSRGQNALGEEAGSANIGAIEQHPGGAEGAVEDALANLTSENPQNATASLNTLRIVINAGLEKKFKNAIRSLASTKSEIDLFINTANNNPSNPEFLLSIGQSTKEEAELKLKKARALQATFVKFAKGVYLFEKKAHMESKMRKLAQEKAKLTKEEIAKGEVELKDKKLTQPKPGEVIDPAEKAKRASEDFDLTTYEGRKEYREKLAAANSVKFSDMLNKAHPKGSVKLTGIEGTNDAVIEDLEDVHSQMLKVLETEPKVKKAAQQLDKLVREGKVNADDIPEMVKEGLDKEVAAYWKKYYGQVDGGSEFAAGLLKDYSTAKTKTASAVDVDNYKAKFAKAFDLAYEMADLGLVMKNNTAIRAEAEKMENFTDAAFDAVKRVVAQHRNKLAKTASVQVGVAYDRSANQSTNESLESSDLTSRLQRAFSNRKF